MLIVFLIATALPGALAVTTVVSIGGLALGMRADEARLARIIGAAEREARGKKLPALDAEIENAFASAIPGFSTSEVTEMQLGECKLLVTHKQRQLLEAALGEPTDDLARLILARVIVQTVALRQAKAA